MQEDTQAARITPGLVGPLLLANVLQSLYNMVDMAVVGRFVGSEALAALSSTVQLCFIINSIGVGLTVGGGVIVGRRSGAGDTEGCHRATGNLLALTSAVALAVTALGYLLYRPALGLMQLPGEAMPHAAVYMRTVLLGTLFSFGYLSISAACRAVGDTVGPLYLMGATSLLNIALDLLFVAGWQWGVHGAALATVIAQAASLLLAAVYLWHRQHHNGFSPRHLRPDRAMSAQILSSGLPTALRMAALNATYAAVAALFNACGIAEAAAAGVGLKINTFVAMPCWATGSAVTILSGQAMGAKRPQDAMRAARDGMKFGFLMTGGCILLLHLFIRPVLSLFVRDPAVLALGVRYLRICCSFCFIPYVVMYHLDAFATGVGHPLVAMGNSLLHSVFMRLGLSLLLTRVMRDGFLALCTAEALSPILPAAVGIGFYRRFSRRATVES